MTRFNEFPVDYRYSGEYQPPPNSDSWWLERVGKKAAGRLLDCREHNEFPEV